jgi:hypothetical protein
MPRFSRLTKARRTGVMPAAPSRSNRSATSGHLAPRTRVVRGAGRPARWTRRRVGGRRPPARNPRHGLARRPSLRRPGPPRRTPSRVERPSSGGPRIRRIVRSRARHRRETNGAIAGSALSSFIEYQLTYCSLARQVARPISGSGHRGLPRRLPPPPRAAVPRPAPGAAGNGPGPPPHPTRGERDRLRGRGDLRPP